LARIARTVDPRPKALRKETPMRLDPCPGAGRPVAACVVPILPLLLLLAPSDLHALRLGNTVVTPTLELYGTYDDNVLLRSDDDPYRPVEDDWIGRIIPGITLARPEGAWRFSAGYRNEFLFYKDLTERDVKGTNHIATLGLGRALGERTSFSLDDTFRKGTEVSSLSEAGLTDVTRTGILPRSRDYIVNSAAFTATHALSRRFSLSGNLGYGYNRYDPVRSQEVEIEPRRENHLVDSRVTASYAVHPRNSVTASVGFSYNDYGDEGDSRIYLASLGDSWQITSDLTLNGSAGVEYLNEHDRGPDRASPTVSDSSVNPYGELGATYVLERFRFLVSFFYGLTDSSGLGTTVTSRSVRLGVDYTPWQRLVMRAFGFYSKTDSAGEDQDRPSEDIESIQAGTSVDYELTRWCTTRVQYNYIDQDSSGTGAGGTYKDNRVLLGFILTAPE